MHVTDVRGVEPVQQSRALGLQEPQRAPLGVVAGGGGCFGGAQKCPQMSRSIISCDQVRSGAIGSIAQLFRAATPGAWG